MAQIFPNEDITRSAMELNILIFALTQNLVGNEAEKLGAELRNASSSVEKNISEALEYEHRMGPKNFRKLVEAAHNSVNIVETLLRTVRQLGTGDEGLLNRAESLVTETSTKIGVLSNSWS